MKVQTGIAAETTVVLLTLVALPLVPRESSLLPLFYLIIQGLLTYFAHCPAHYFVGSLVGVRFKRFLLARSAMRKSSSQLLRFIGSRALTFVLVVDRQSISKVSPRARSATLLAGVIASVSLPFVVAIYAVITGSLTSQIITFGFALFYLAFDAVYSPRTGDVYRARTLGTPVG